MFQVNWNSEAAEQYQTLMEAASKSIAKHKKDRKAKPSKAEGLFKQVQKCVRLLQADPRHPGLHTHAYDSIENPYDPGQKVFEAYVQNRTPGAWRLFWCYGPEPGFITIIAITQHP